MASTHDKRGMIYLADVVFRFSKKIVKFVKFINVVHSQNLLNLEYVVKTVNLMNNDTSARDYNIKNS